MSDWNDSNCRWYRSYCCWPLLWDITSVNFRSSSPVLPISAWDYTGSQRKEIDKTILNLLYEAYHSKALVLVSFKYRVKEKIQTPELRLAPNSSEPSPWNRDSYSTERQQMWPQSGYHGSLNITWWIPWLVAPLCELRPKPESVHKPHIRQGWMDGCGKHTEDISKRPLPLWEEGEMKTYTRCIFCKLISLMFVFHVELPCASLGCLCQAGTQSVMHARVALVVVTKVKMRLMHSTPPHCASPPPPLPLCASWLEISVKTLTPPLVFTLLHLRPPGLLTDKGQLSELDRNAQRYTAHSTAW